MLEAQGKKRGVVKLTSIVVGMFAFGFMLVPLYDIVCEVTGFNGKQLELMSYQGKRPSMKVVW